MALVAVLIGFALAGTAGQSASRVDRLPENPCELLTIQQVSAATGVSVVAAQRAPSVAATVEAQRRGVDPPPGNVCSYETRSEFGTIDVGVMTAESNAVAYWEVRERHFRTFPGSAQAVPGLGIDAWMAGGTSVRVLVRNDLQLYIATRLYQPGSRDVILSVARAILRRIESGPLPELAPWILEGARETPRQR